jgi:hypothetical protein
MKRLCAAFFVVMSIAPAVAQQPPTATEIFHLRTECAALADKLMHGFDEMTPTIEIPTRTLETYSVSSHYDPVTNRCYADLTSFFSTAPVVNGRYLPNSKDPWIEHKHRNLYDAQTKDVLAGSSIDGDKRYGVVFEAGHQYGFADATASFDYANDYINGKMEDDRKQ